MAEALNAIPGEPASIFPLAEYLFERGRRQSLLCTLARSSFHARPLAEPLFVDFAGLQPQGPPLASFLQGHGATPVAA
jgi:hypothetical protein